MTRLLAGLILLLCSGCAATTAVPIAPGDRTTKGFRIYDPKPMLLVTSKSTQVFFVPSYDRGYAVRFWAFLAKNDLTLKTADGAMTELGSHIDTTATLTLFQALGQEALKQVDKLKALGSNVDGTLTGKEGLYEFEFDANGKFVGLKRHHLP
jgi:hypothetical protein